MPREKLDGLKPISPETPLFETLRRIAEKRAGDFSDVLVLSDGGETGVSVYGERELGEAAGGLPVSTIGFGGEKIENLVLEKLLADSFVVAGSPAELEGTVSFAGEGGKRREHREPRDQESGPGRRCRPLLGCAGYSTP